MKLRGEKNLPFFIAVALTLTLTATVCLFTLSCSGASLDLDLSYYFICCYIRDDAVSASALSGTVSSYGGAGYILGFNGAYYITVACYYSENDANTVCASLQRIDLDCEVVCAERDGFDLKSYAARKNSELYAGNLNTLQSLSAVAYECANGLDTGSYSQTAAKSVIEDIESGLKGLKSANLQNCFTAEIDRLLAECDQACDGFIFSKNLRRLQIAFIDCILNIELY